MATAPVRPADLEADAPRAAGRTGARRFSFSEYAGFIPAVVLYGLFFAVPLAIVVAYSFWEVVDYNVVHNWTLDNYRYFFSVPTYVTTLWATLWVSVLATGLTIAIAFPFAYWLVRYVPRKLQRVLLVLVILPFWTSYLLRVMSWKVILGYNGVLNSGLMGLGIIDEPSTALLYNSTAVIITLTHAWAAFAILPIFVSLEKVDRTLVEAATDLGDGPLRSFLRVTLPLSAPGVISAALIVMIPTVGDYVTPKLVGGKDGVMIANAIQAQFGKASNWPLGAALSVTTMIIVSLMAGATVLVFRALQRLAR